ncbi:4'-phosphopantetheinyl transferase superfamily protein [Paenibacillus sp. SI8]|uniref:4'-phosphopantetheinyl transferase family protein n=1 Tax=unclassified Paenibacillus TaxID=185978 RepID=UPI0034672E42
MIIISHLDEIDRALFERVLACLPHNKQEKIRKYRRESDQLRTLLGEITVRTYIMQTLHQADKDIEFKTGPYGKPYLAGPFNLHYNVSHSGKWVACLFDSYPVGIDVEEISAIDLAIAKSYFAKNEYEDLMRQPQHERISYFFDLWTLKESFIKAVGKGLSIPLDSFSFTKADGGYRFTSADYPEDQYFYQHYAIDPNYKLAACSMHKHFAAAPTQLTGTEACLTYLMLNGG